MFVCPEHLLHTASRYQHLQKKILCRQSTYTCSTFLAEQGICFFRKTISLSFLIARLELKIYSQYRSLEVKTPTTTIQINKRKLIEHLIKISNIILYIIPQLIEDSLRKFVNSFKNITLFFLVSMNDIQRLTIL